MHPNFLRIIGRSSKTSPDLYLVYHGGAEYAAERMLASVLREELSKCLVLGLTLVSGISSALSYLASNEYPLEKMDSTDFDLLVGSSGHLQICMISGSTRPWSEEEMRTEVRLNHVLELFDSLCKRAFREANCVLYADEVDRSTDFYSGSSSIPDLSLSTSTPASQPLPNTRLNRAERRELVWTTSNKASNLDVITQQIENFLVRFRTSTGNYVRDRRYSAEEHGQIHHRCPGYIREEIYLGPGEESTFILSHSTPSPQEMCTVCGKIVEESGWFRCTCGKPDDGLKTTLKCPNCRFWHHIGCLCATPLQRVSYVCPIFNCGQVLSTNRQLRDHRRSRHSFKCPCGSFRSDSNRIFQVHLKYCGSWGSRALGRRAVGCQSDDSQRIPWRFLDLMDAVF
ncbi:hypothetical protein B0H13DRAFT_238203 [Mycena leptocephala]|nr:hypothetical protein B0H13DRAFT_238203 [Mycena leptocephala]